MNINAYKWVTIISFPYILMTSIFLYLMAIAGGGAQPGWGHSIIGFFMSFSLVSYLILFACNLKCLIEEYFTKRKSRLPISIVLYILSWQVFHALTIFTNEYWKNSYMKIFICILGLSFLIFVTVKVVKFFLSEKAKQS